jgi:hypothetical protein
MVWYNYPISIAWYNFITSMAWYKFPISTSFLSIRFGRSFTFFYPHGLVQVSCRYTFAISTSLLSVQVSYHHGLEQVCYHQSLVQVFYQYKFPIIMAWYKFPISTSSLSVQVSYHYKFPIIMVCYKFPVSTSSLSSWPGTSFLPAWFPTCNKRTILMLIVHLKHATFGMQARTRQPDNHSRNFYKSRPLHFTCCLDTH